jgi:(1->4)-alpha-D-glucan 1-alpha-D-glucosylmutase
MTLGGRWGETSIALPEGDWQSALGGSRYGGGEKRVSDLLGEFPVELLVRK